MRKIVIGLLITALSTSTWGLATVASAGPEVCFAANPGQPKCTLTMTAASGSTGATGWEGVGSWNVQVKRGKKIYRFKSDGSAVPGPLQVWGHTFVFKAGDVVTATANTPGSSILVGHTS